MANISLTPDGKELKFAAIAASSSGDNTVVSAVPGKRIRVFNTMVVAGSSVTAKWKSGASTDLSGDMQYAANGGYCTDSMSGMFRTAVGEALVLNLSGAVTVGGHLAFVEE